MALRVAGGKYLIGGRPMCLPLALAFLNPALTRSRMQSRSNSAKALMIWKSSLPVVVVKSRPAEKLTNSMPRRRCSWRPRIRRAWSEPSWWRRAVDRRFNRQLADKDPMFDLSPGIVPRAA